MSVHVSKLWQELVTRFPSLQSIAGSCSVPIPVVSSFDCSSPVREVPLGFVSEISGPVSLVLITEGEIDVN